MDSIDEVLNMDSDARDNEMESDPAAEELDQCGFQVPIKPKGDDNSVDSFSGDNRHVLVRIAV